MNSVEIFSALEAVRQSLQNSVEPLLNVYSISENQWLTFIERWEKNWILSLDEEDVLRTELLRKVPHSREWPCSLRVYARLLSIANIMYANEKVGIPEEHAYKLAFIFEKNESDALEYLKRYHNHFPKTEQLLFEACLFTLPQGDCNWSLWRKWCKRYLLDKRFRTLILPQANELEDYIQRHYSEGLVGTLSLQKLVSLHDEYSHVSENVFRHFIRHGLTKQDYGRFIRIPRRDNDIQIPPVSIEGKSIGFPGMYLEKIAVLDELQAARACYLGKLTHSLLSLSGDKGEPCVLHGLTSDYGGFYIVCEGSLQKKSIDDPIIACAWVWRSKNNAIVFDSIQKSEHADIASVKSFFYELSKVLVEENHTERVLVGSQGGVSSKIGKLPLIVFHEKFIDYTDYSDALFYQRVIYEKNKPYYGYGEDSKAKQALASRLRLVMTQWKEYLNELIEIINWSLLNHEVPICKLGESIAKELKCESDIQKLCEVVERFIKGTVSENEIQALIDMSKSAINLINQEGIPLLIWLTERRFEKSIEALLKKKCNLNVFDAENKTPLIVAVMQNTIELVKKYIDAGADVNAVDNVGKSAMHYAMEKLFSLNVNEINLRVHMLALIVKEYKSSENLPLLNDNGETLLIWAIENNFDELGFALIEKAIQINVRDKLGRTPLSIAIEKNNVATVQALIHAKVNIATLDNKGRTLLMWAGANGYINVIRDLMNEDVYLDERDYDGKTALSYAIHHGHLAAALLLIEAGADVNAYSKYVNSPLLTLLSEASFWKGDDRVLCKEVALKLIHNGAQVNEKDQSTFRTPLMYAALNGLNDIVKVLIEQGANKDEKDLLGQTAKMIAHDLRPEVFSLL